MPLPMPSSRFEMSLERLSSPDAVKKLTGLSSAELTFLPVARRFCVTLASEAVFCSESRFCLTAEERVIPDITEPFWYAFYWTIPLGSDRQNGIGIVIPSKRTWLMVFQLRIDIG